MRFLFRKGLHVADTVKDLVPQIKAFLDGFFARKPKSFDENSILKLPERWRKMIDQNGQYIME